MIVSSMTATILRRTRALAAALLGLALLAGAVTAAETPLIAGPVTDRTGVLEGAEDEIEAAIDTLLDEQNVQLWVVFIPTTDGVPAPDFAGQIAEANSLGANDALLLVAVDDRTDAIWVADALDRITDAEIDDVIANALEPRLRDGDFPGAVVATTEALGEAAATDVAEPIPGATEPVAGGGGIQGPGDDGGGGAILLPLVLLLGGGGLLAWWVVQRRSAHRVAEERDRRTGRLAREANALLIATDERVRDAGQEIGFVEAEYGEAEVGPLRKAVATARESLREAFAIRQRLDDAEPETPEEREQLLNALMGHLKTGQAALDGEAARIKALRDLERDAPSILEKLPDRIAAVEARLPDARVAFDSLARYAPSTRAPVTGHLEEARKGLEGARSATERGRAALTGRDTRVAAREARRAEQGLTGAAALLDAIEKLRATAVEAEPRIAADVAEAETDLAAARSATTGPTTGAAAGTVEPRLAAAETALRQARAAAEAIPLDPIAALRQAAEARRLADEALAAAHADAEHRERVLQAVETSLVAAQADLDRAANFISTRRGSVGRQARTRLAESDRLLERAFALRDADPRAAMEAARRAERLAEDAYELAADDIDRYGGGMSGGTLGGGGSSGSDVAGVILGGILGGILSGGGRGGGWGGSPWGSSGGGGGGGWGGPFGGGGGGGWGGGGFGGGGFGGGGFGGGGGGGRSRGGRW
jgi:TPM domain